MLQYLLTAIAGIALGIVGMRVWQAREVSVAADPGAASAIPVDAPPSGPTAGSGRKLLYGAGALVAVAGAIFAFRPGAAPSADVGASAVGAAVPGGKQLADVDTMIARLAERLRNNPNDGEGFRMLGWSYVMTGHPDQAIQPYKKALALLPNSALVHSGYGEAMVGIARNTVTPEAKAEFERAVAIDPKEPRSRYFLALWQAQHGEEKVALDKWVALANEGPADAPWQTDLHKQIAVTSAKLGVDVSSRFKSAPAQGGLASGGAALDAKTVQAANALPQEQRQAMVDGMVEGLAAKLKTNPANPDGWMLLLRSRMVMKQSDQAARDLVTARKALSDDATGL
ncbi:MAG: hypothetical protein KGM49_13670, partial [Sphingomonadales bacterium]|nr:hypothetical protein [Sphingomonadales bacterium]